MKNGYSDEMRQEKIDGVMYTRPNGNWEHATVMLNIARIIDQQLDINEKKVFCGNFDYMYDYQNGDYVTPDVMVCSKKFIRNKACVGVPDFVVEVLSPFSIKKDRIIKRGIYEKSGIEEYLIIEPVACTVEDYVLINGKYELKNVWFYDDEEADHSFAELKLSVGLNIKLNLRDIFAYRFGGEFGGENE